MYEQDIIISRAELRRAVQRVQGHRIPVWKGPAKEKLVKHEIEINENILIERCSVFMS